jgi:hypothetical protein
MNNLKIGVGGETNLVVHGVQRGTAGSSVGKPGKSYTGKAGGIPAKIGGGTICRPGKGPTVKR